MLFIDDKKIEQIPAAIDGLTAKQQKTALVFIRGVVYACCTMDEESDYWESFYVSQLFGKDIATWPGTPLECIYDACKQAKKWDDEDEDVDALAFQAFEQLLITCLINDERRFDSEKANDKYDTLYYWSEKCAVREGISDFMTPETKEKLRLVMSVLLDEVKVEGTLGYKELQIRVAKENSELAKQMSYRRGDMAMLLGDLNRHIQGDPPTKPRIPTITAIVVGTQSKVPGEGIDPFPGFEGYAKAVQKRDTKKQREITKAEQNKVYDYGYSAWKKIYTELFG